MSELDGWKHCPRCGAGVTVEDGRAECAACGLRHYASSKPTASALCVDDEGRVLLSCRAIEPFKGLWDFPGGFLEEDEHPLDCVRRELQEEAGVEIEPRVLLGVWVDRYGSDGSAAATLNLYYTARIVAGEPQAADDVAELRWFAPGELPVDKLAFGHLDEVLRVWQEHA